MNIILTDKQARTLWTMLDEHARNAQTLREELRWIRLRDKFEKRAATVEGKDTK